jgi:hypothetical protein
MKPPRANSNCPPVGAPKPERTTAHSLRREQSAPVRSRRVATNLLSKESSRRRERTSPKTPPQPATSTRRQPQRSERSQDRPVTPQTVEFEPFDVTTYPGFLLLAPGQQDFLRAWSLNGRNATRAYMEAHPNVSVKVAAVEGFHTLRVPKVKDLAAAYVLTALQSEHMGKAEVIALLARRARGNIADLFGPGGQMLHPDEWPEPVASAVKSFKVSATGVSVVMHDAVQACREVLELHGAAKGTGTGLSELAAALREDLARNEPPASPEIPTSG